MNAVLDRDLSSSWLDSALKIAALSCSLQAAQTDLLARLSEESLGDAALKKTLTALTRVWLQPAAEAAPYAVWALKYKDKVTDWRPLHIGALLAREPFIGSLLNACSMELRGKGQVDTVSLRSRMRDLYGPKRSIDVATQRGVKTLRSLGLLTGAPQTSLSGCDPIVIRDPQLATWLIGCLLQGRGAESIAIEDLSYAPEFFGLELPVALPRAAAGLRKHVEGVGRTVFALDL